MPWNAAFKLQGYLQQKQVPPDLGFKARVPLAGWPLRKLAVGIPFVGVRPKFWGL